MLCSKFLNQANKQQQKRRKQGPLVTWDMCTPKPLCIPLHSIHISTPGGEGDPQVLDKLYLDYYVLKSDSECMKLHPVQYS